MNCGPVLGDKEQTPKSSSVRDLWVLSNFLMSTGWKDQVGVLLSMKRLQEGT